MFKKVLSPVKNIVKKVIKKVVRVIAIVVAVTYKAVSLTFSVGSGVLEWLEDRGIMPKLFVKLWKFTTAITLLPLALVTVLVLQGAHNMGAYSDEALIVTLALSMLGMLSSIMGVLDFWLTKAIIVILSLIPGFGIPMLIISLVAGVVMYASAKLAESIVDERLQTMLMRGLDSLNTDTPDVSDVEELARRLQELLASVESMGFVPPGFKDDIGTSVIDLTVASEQLRRFNEQLDAYHAEWEGVYESLQQQEQELSDFITVEIDKTLLSWSSLLTLEFHLRRCGQWIG